MTGWIKIHRKLSDNPLWTCEPFTRGQAWVDLIMLASFDDVFFFVRGIQVSQKRGQVCWSEANLADRWKWSRTKLRKFLNDLEKERQIIQQKNNVIQIITIVNYEEYQEKEPKDGQQKKDVCKEDSGKFNFKKAFINIGVDEKIVFDWLLVRKTKKAANTETAFNSIKNEIEKSGLSANECIKIAAEKSWQGFKADWIKDKSLEQQTTKVPRLIDNIHAK